MTALVIIQLPTSVNVSPVADKDKLIDGCVPAEGAFAESSICLNTWNETSEILFGLGF